MRTPLLQEMWWRACESVQVWGEELRQPADPGSRAGWNIQPGGLSGGGFIFVVLVFISSFYPWTILRALVLFFSGPQLPIHTQTNTVIHYCLLSSSTGAAGEIIKVFPDLSAGFIRKLINIDDSTITSLCAEVFGFQKLFSEPSRVWNWSFKVLSILWKWELVPW